MSQGADRSDLLSLKRELLNSARLDVQPLPASVRKQALLAATVAGVTSASVGTATATVASASAGTATAASASAALGTSASVALGLAKLGGIGALLVSVGTATYYGTAGTWQPSRTTGSTQPAAEARTAQRARSSGAPILPRAASSSSQNVDDVPLPRARTLEHVPSPSGSSLTTPELREVSSPDARALPSTTRSEHDAQAVGIPRAADAAGSDNALPTSSHPIRHSKRSNDDRDRVSVQPMPSEATTAGLASSPGSLQNLQPEAREALSEELALLDSARARLAAGDPAATLLRLDQYTQGFPRGALQPEAMFLRVQALSQSGQTSAAATVGRHFLNQYPTSPHADRVRTLIDSHPDDQNP